MRDEVVLGVERRRRWRDEQKLEILDEVGRNGWTVADVARHHDISRQQIYQWRQQLKRKGLWAVEASPMFLEVPSPDELPASWSPARDDDAVAPRFGSSFAPVASCIVALTSTKRRCGVWSMSWRRHDRAWDGVRVYLACGVTDMRKGIAGLSAIAQDVLRQKPSNGAVFAFRGRRGDRSEAAFLGRPGLLPLLQGARTGPVSVAGGNRGRGIRLTSAQLAMLWEGIDWRRPDWGAPPARVG